MNCETGLLHSLGVWSVPVCRTVENPRGARHWRHFRAAHLYTVGSFDPDHDAVMRIGGKLRAAGPFYRSASSARFEYGFPPPRIVNSAVVLKASASAENGAELVCSFR